MADEISKIIGLSLPSGGGGGSGVWGISDATGAYTYYATLTLALAAASSGDTIELFANVTETGAVTVNLVDGVIINGNGHTYILDNVSADSCFTPTTTYGYYRIYNLTAKRVNGTGSCAVFMGKTNSNAIGLHLICDGSTFINESSYYTTAGTAGSYGLSVYNLYSESNGNGIAGREVTNCQSWSTGGYGIFAQTGTIRDSFCHSTTTYAAYVKYLYNTTCISTATYAAYGNQPNGYVLNSTFISTGGSAVYFLGVGTTIQNCSAYSTAGSGFYSAGAGPVAFNNCSGYSTSAYGFSGYGELYNCTAISTVSFGIYSTSMATIANCYIESRLDDAAGHGIQYHNAYIVGKQLFNCTIKVKNAGAYCIKNHLATPRALNYGNNSFIGATTPVDPNLSQGILNSSDSQGNLQN